MARDWAQSNRVRSVRSGTATPPEAHRTQVRAARGFGGTVASDVVGTIASPGAVQARPAGRAHDELELTTPTALVGRRCPVADESLSAVARQRVQPAATARIADSTIKGSAASAFIDRSGAVALDTFGAIAGIAVTTAWATGVAGGELQVETASAEIAGGLTGASKGLASVTRPHIEATGSAGIAWVSFKGRATAALVEVGVRTFATVRRVSVAVIPAVFALIDAANAFGTAPGSVVWRADHAASAAVHGVGR